MHGDAAYRINVNFSRPTGSSHEDEMRNCNEATVTDTTCDSAEICFFVKEHFK